MFDRVLNNQGSQGNYIVCKRTIYRKIFAEILPCNFKVSFIAFDISTIRLITKYD